MYGKKLILAGKYEFSFICINNKKLQQQEHH
jgi:hypothetical protein